MKNIFFIKVIFHSATLKVSALVDLTPFATLFVLTHLLSLEQDWQLWPKN